MGNALVTSMNDKRFNPNSVFSNTIKNIVTNQQTNYKGTMIKVNVAKACAYNAVKPDIDTSGPNTVVSVPFLQARDPADPECRDKGYCLDVAYVGYQLKENPLAVCSVANVGTSVDTTRDNSGSAQALYSLSDADKFMADYCAKSLYDQGCIGIGKNKFGANVAKVLDNINCTNAKGAFRYGPPECSCLNSISGMNLNTFPSSDNSIDRTWSNTNPYGLGGVQLSDTNKFSKYSLNIFKQDSTTQYPVSIDNICAVAMLNSNGLAPAYTLARDRSPTTVCINQINIIDSNIQSLTLSDIIMANSCGNKPPEQQAGTDTAEGISIKSDTASGQDAVDQCNAIVTAIGKIVTDAKNTANLLTPLKIVDTTTNKSLVTVNEAVAKVQQNATNAATQFKNFASAPSASISGAIKIALQALAKNSADQMAIAQSASDTIKTAVNSAIAAKQANDAAIVTANNDASAATKTIKDNIAAIDSNLQNAKNSALLLVSASINDPATNNAIDEITTASAKAKKHSVDAAAQYAKMAAVSTVDAANAIRAAILSLASDSSIQKQIADTATTNTSTYVGAAFAKKKADDAKVQQINNEITALNKTIQDTVALGNSSYQTAKTSTTQLETSKVVDEATTQALSLATNASNSLTQNGQNALAQYNTFISNISTITIDNANSSKTTINNIATDVVTQKKALDSAVSTIATTVPAALARNAAKVLAISESDISLNNARANLTIAETSAMKAQQEAAILSKATIVDESTATLVNKAIASAKKAKQNLDDLTIQYTNLTKASTPDQVASIRSKIKIIESDAAAMAVAAGQSNNDAVTNVNNLIAAAKTKQMMVYGGIGGVVLLIIIGIILMLTVFKKKAE